MTFRRVYDESLHMQFCRFVDEIATLNKPMLRLQIQEQTDTKRGVTILLCLFLQDDYRLYHHWMIYSAAACKQGLISSLQEYLW